ncbi:MAG: hypothetical protein ACXABN_17920 [Candidatus Thorarchaeota archaeon]|jgi:hypothetical protein
MTATEKLDEIHKEIDELGYNPSAYGIDDDEDMILFALRYLLSNLEDAFVETVNDNDPDVWTDDAIWGKEQE